MTPGSGELEAGGLERGELELTGRITTASNATFLGSIGGVPVVYKPVAGEHPLWDFPDGTLANREVAAYRVSEAFGWKVVPRTWLRDGPMGPGMVQLWQDADPEQDAVDLVPWEIGPGAGWRRVFDGRDEQDRAVTLVHEDSVALRRMAVFDIVVNNADRKGNHILAMPDGHRHGVDHGLTFHVEHKLRTVLWGWLGDALSAEELDGVDRVRAGLDGDLGVTLGELLDADELEALAARCDRLRAAGRFPAPRGQMPAVPWPLF
ncbi:MULTISPECIES: SCO1664 family protein [Cryobacterium]|uniref:SCO1664 family protein n=2 Tax=Cryobacterium TaxID=69578 RepID=A0ABY2IS65_9MICO|nr:MULTISPECIES: SCO1664 family protein [Cryobacterium]MDY7527277.1 SCO1664 family protein [Cryobacterium sp. 10C2]MDY7556936.1 SCO1664 family protein [Cryobacterium sp. 10C3]MEB0201350.1 SCO1664 family protein [Cryobacterium sp. 5I3]MEB0285853.1 SCO1664 family protein [Cryobacterium sp. 10S3]MEB0290309.1 SCO1664 family protein [Cryobacterium sp. 10C2]